MLFFCTDTKQFHNKPLQTYNTHDATPIKDSISIGESSKHVYFREECIIILTKEGNIFKNGKFNFEKFVTKPTEENKMKDINMMIII